MFLVRSQVSYRPLVMTSILGFICILIFAIFGFFHFHSFFYNKFQVSQAFLFILLRARRFVLQSTNECNSLLECLTVFLHFGLLNGIENHFGDYLLWIWFFIFNLLTQTLIWGISQCRVSLDKWIIVMLWTKCFLLGNMDRDFLFFVVINILVLNLILGMIIDTFSHLRERELEKTKKLMNFCLTCGLPKVSFKEIIMLLYKPLHARRTSYPMGNKHSVD